MVLSRRTIYTIITPLPPQVTRETVMTAFRDHGLMIELNPMVIQHAPCKKPPRFAPADEYHCPWYEIQDKVHYTPGGAISGKIVYHACLHDLHNGLQTHCYAALGTDIRGKWLLCGSLPGEPPEHLELGVEKPAQGLYVREDIDMRTNMFMTAFVKKNLQRAHEELLKRLIVGVGLVDSLPPPISSSIGSPLAMTRPASISSSQLSVHSAGFAPLPSPSRDTIGIISIAPNPPIASPMLSRKSMKDVVQRRTAASLAASPTSSQSGSSRSSTHRRLSNLDYNPAESGLHSPGMVHIEEPVTDWEANLVYRDARSFSHAANSASTQDDKYYIDRIDEEDESDGESFSLDIPAYRPADRVS